jgi:hypothetical protein
MCIDCQRELERSGSVGGAGHENPEEQAEETVTGDLEY